MTIFDSIGNAFKSVGKVVTGGLSHVPLINQIPGLQPSSSSSSSSSSTPTSITDQIEVQWEDLTPEQHQLVLETIVGMAVMVLILSLIHI